MVFNPSYEAIIRPNDTLIAMGEKNSLKGLEKLM